MEGWDDKKREIASLTENTKHKWRKAQSVTVLLHIHCITQYWKFYRWKKEHTICDISVNVIFRVEINMYCRPTFVSRNCPILYKVKFYLCKLINTHWRHRALCIVYEILWLNEDSHTGVLLHRQEKKINSVFPKRFSILWLFILLRLLLCLIWRTSL